MHFTRKLKSCSVCLFFVVVNKREIFTSRISRNLRNCEKKNLLAVKDSTPATANQRAGLPIEPSQLRIRIRIPWPWTIRTKRSCRERVAATDNSPMFGRCERVRGVTPLNEQTSRRQMEKLLPGISRGRLATGAVTLRSASSACSVKERPWQTTAAG